MLGKTIKNLANNNAKDCFIDTCVYIEYGIYFSHYHKQVENFFNSERNRHTSESVSIEIGYFKDFTAQFEKQLVHALTRGKRKDVINFPRTIFTGFSDSRWGLIESIIGLIKNRDAEGMASEYRAFRRLVRDSIDDAIAKTNKPLEKQSTDKKFIGSLAYINDPDDAQIIADAVLWAAQYPYRHFCTCDNIHIMKNKNRLELDITKCYGRNCLVFIHLEDA